jgi:hypothetical protein
LTHTAQCFTKTLKKIPFNLDEKFQRKCHFNFVQIADGKYGNIQRNKKFFSIFTQGRIFFPIKIVLNNDQVTFRLIKGVITIPDSVTTIHHWNAFAVATSEFALNALNECELQSVKFQGPRQNYTKSVMYYLNSSLNTKLILY